MSRRVLVARLDGPGEVLICGPAIRAVAAQAEVTLLVSQAGAAAAALLPGVTNVLVWDCPWISAAPTPFDPLSLDAVVERIWQQHFDEAIVLTSAGQSSLPTALMLRSAGVTRISATSMEYPGSLLDEHLAEPPDLPEPVRMLRVVTEAGFPPAPGDGAGLAVRSPPGVTVPIGLPSSYLVVHPGASAPSLTCSPATWRSIVLSLRAAGYRIVLTGDESEIVLTADLAMDGDCLDVVGQLSLAELSLVMSGADAVIISNTGPAHLAAAVGTPIVSLFSPVVSAAHWAPYTERLSLLGWTNRGCAKTQAQFCPVPEHPCLDLVTGDDVLAALDRLGIERPAVIG